VKRPANPQPYGDCGPFSLWLRAAERVVINGGTLTNQSHQLFVVGAPYIFVAQSVVVLTPDGETIVFFDTAPGMKGAITCVATAGGFTLTVSGFFTPAT
jgi:hypothetical protein